MHCPLIVLKEVRSVQNTNEDGGNGEIDESKLTKDDLKLVKCPRCNEKLKKYLSIQHTNKRYYHKKCYEEWRGNVSDRTQLFDYVTKLYQIKQPTVAMYTQVARYIDEHNFTYKGMELTLKYFYEIMGNKPRKGDSLGIIPWKYEEATEQYIHQIKINESYKNLDKAEKKAVYVSPKKKRRDKSIDIDLL